MNERLMLGRRGVAALVALCHHVRYHGTVPDSAHAIAAALLAVCDADDESHGWHREDDVNRTRSRARMCEALEGIMPAKLEAERRAPASAKEELDALRRELDPFLESQGETDGQ